MEVKRPKKDAKRLDIGDTMTTNAAIGKPKHRRLTSKIGSNFVTVLNALKEQKNALVAMNKLINELPENQIKRDMIDELLSLQMAWGNAAVACGLGIATTDDMRALIDKAPEA